MMRPLHIFLFLALSIFSIPAEAGSKQDWQRCPKVQKPDVAIPACTRIIKRRREGRKNKAIAYSNRCGAKNNKKQYEAAISDCNAAIKLNYKYASAYNNRGNAYLDKGMPDKAIADYDKAITLDPKEKIYYSNLGRAYARKREYDRAISYYDMAIRLDPKFSYALRLRSLTWKAKGDTDKAIEDLEQAIRINPKDADNYWQLAQIYWLLAQIFSNDGYSNKAIANYDMVIRLAPKFSRAYRQLAKAYFKKACVLMPIWRRHRPIFTRANSRTRNSLRDRFSQNLNVEHFRGSRRMILSISNCLNRFLFGAVIAENR